MIHFHNVRWQNFLSSGNTWTEIQLDRSPNTLVVGENGAGKSTMLDALCFSLFGKPFRKINIPQLINSVNQKGLMVEVNFTIGSTEYRVVRGEKPKLFEIYKDGCFSTRVSGSSRAEYSQAELQLFYSDRYPRLINVRTFHAVTRSSTA